MLGGLRRILVQHSLMYIRHLFRYPNIMQLLVIYETDRKVIDVADKSEIKAAVEKVFENEIRNRSITIQYYVKRFDSYVNLEYADVEDGGKIKLIVQDSMNTDSQRSPDEIHVDADKDQSKGYTTLSAGDNVKLTLIGSSVNMVAGNQHVTHGNTQPEVNEEHLVKIVNDHTKELTRDRILEHFEHEKLHKPDFVVHPQMLEVDVTGYYKGRHGLGLMEDNSNFEESQNADSRIQLTNELGFRSKQRSKDKVIKIEDLVASIRQKGREDLVADDAVGFIAIVASAGSGKTTLARRIARQALSSVTAKENTTTRKHKMVHYVELKDVEEQKSIKPSKFLFGGLYKNDSVADQAFEWLLKNQTEAILIFDGLDQASWNFDNNTLRSMRKYDKKNTSTIMYNILARNILRHATILIASRESKVSELPALARPERIIELNGLTLVDSQNLFVRLLGGNGKKLWRTIENNSPRLIQLITIPVFLILTAIVMGRDQTRPPPATVTELYDRIVLNLKKLENVRNSENLLAIIIKLKALAFRGMEQERVVFKKTDLRSFGITANEVQDLMTKVPGNNLLSRRLMEGDFKFFFCHQSMQEFLAASFVAEMTLEEFSQFNDKYLCNSTWSVVRRFVGGIVFSTSTNVVHKVSDMKKKQKIMSRSLLSQLKMTNARSSSMELYTVIYESNNSDLTKHLSVIDVSENTLSLDQAHVVGSLIARSPLLEHLNLSNCRIDDHNLQVIAEHLKDRVQVFKLTTTSNHDIELLNEGEVIIISGKGVFGHFSKKDATLEFEWFSNIDRVLIIMFFKILFEPESIKINVLYDDLQSLSAIPLIHKVDKLLLHACEDRNNDWSLIEVYVRKYQVERLDIEVEGKTSSEKYCDISKHGYEMSRFGIHVKIHSIFFIRNADDIQSILQACHQNQIKSIRCVIDWLYSPSLDDIISLISIEKCEKLSLMYWRKNERLDEETIEKVQKISNTHNTEFEVSCGDDHNAWWEIAIRYQAGSVTLNEDEHLNHKLSRSVGAVGQNRWRTITQKVPTGTRESVHKTPGHNLQRKEGKDVHHLSESPLAGSEIKQNISGSESHRIRVSKTFDEGQHVNQELSTSVAAVGQSRSEAITQKVSKKTREAVCKTRGHSLKRKGDGDVRHPSFTVKRSGDAAAACQITHHIDGSIGHQSKGFPTLAAGAHVEQTCIESSVNVVAEINRMINVTYANIEPAEINNEDLIKIVNDNTKEMTRDRMLVDFMDDQLHGPDFVVHPQMLEVDVNAYYKGRYGLGLTENKSSSGTSRNDDSINQLREEFGFHRQPHSEDRVIEIDDLMASIWQKEELVADDATGVTCIVGSAGSGKTTLIRRIARHALGISSNENESMPQGQEKQMVHYIELKDVLECTDIKPSKFLFGGLFKSVLEEDHAFEWLDEHQMNAILIFDGLDEARWDFNHKKLRNIKKRDKASTSTIMYNILARNILRHVQIFIASREFKVSELPALARPETIIALHGFASEDVRRLFTFLLGENGESLWEIIEVMSPQALGLLSVPVFLILAAVVMGRDPDRSPPTTVTELYNRILSALQCVGNIRNHKEILSIIHKLKEIAFQGMKQERAVFKVTDLMQVALSAKDVQDLMTKVPGNNLLSRHLIEGDFNFHFSHQSIQEFLAASFVAEMEFQEFSHFHDKHLHDDCWSVVKSLVAGIVFLKSPNDLHTVSDAKKKQDILHQSIVSKLEKANDSSTRMESYKLMRESDNDDLMKQLTAIDVSDMELSRHEAHTVGTLINRNGRLKSLDLSFCNINDDILTTITKCLEGRVQINHIDFQLNNFSPEALGLFLGLCGNESLHLDWKVIRLTRDLPNSTPSTQPFMSRHIKLTKEGHIIKIRDGEKHFKGRFHIKESKFAFDKVYWLNRLIYFSRLFGPESVQIPDGLLYATQDDLRQVSGTSIKKMSEILLDCTQEEKVDWSLIRESVEKYQVAFLNIAVDGKISTEQYEDILRHKKEISGFSVHLVFYISNERDIQSVLDACQAKKVGSVRCEIEFCAARGGINRLVKASKKLTLVYRCEKYMLNEVEMTEVKNIERGLGAQLEILCSQKCDRDAWWVLDSKRR